MEVEEEDPEEAPDQEALAEQDHGRAQNLKSQKTQRSHQPRSSPRLLGAKLNWVLAQALSRELLLATWCYVMRLEVPQCIGVDIRCTEVMSPFQRTEL